MDGTSVIISILLIGVMAMLGINIFYLIKILKLVYEDKMKDMLIANLVSKLPVEEKQNMLFGMKGKD